MDRHGPAFVRALATILLLASGIALADSRVDIPFDATSRPQTAPTVTRSGDTYVFAPGARDVVLTRVAADGATRWSVTHRIPRLQSVELWYGTDRVCAAGVDRRDVGDYEARAACFAIDDGRVLWSTTLPDEARNARARVGADGSVTVLTSPSESSALGTRLFEYAPDGTLRRERIIETAYFLAPSGALDRRIVARRTITQPLPPRQEPALFDGAGNLLAALPDTEEFAGANAPLTLADGSFLTTLDHVLRVYRADGTFLRRYDFPDGDGSLGLQYATLRTGAAFATVVLYIGDDLQAADLMTDGSIANVRALERPPFAVDDALRFGVAQVPYADDRNLFEVLSLDSGDVVRRRYRLFDSTEFRQLRILPGGTLVDAVRVVDSHRPVEAWVRIVSSSGLVSVPTIVPAVQAGIRGAWAADYAPGQGLVIDVDAGSGTVFVPWFTFTRAVLPQRGLTRWYTLQGQGNANDTAVQLGIYENVGGVFTSPPATSARRVGSATLTFETCARGELTYAFDPGENGGASNFMNLARLTPAVDACRLTAGGAPQPVDVPAPAGGFDARLTGTWIDVGAGGQGFMFVVRPGESLFGAWFTFDLAHAPEDPSRQHWFTLQGALPANAQGSATVDLFATRNGGFDAANPVATNAAGQATVVVEACDRLRVDYAFSGNAAGPFDRRGGTVRLQRLGGCAP